MTWISTSSSALVKSTFNSSTLVLSFLTSFSCCSTRFLAWLSSSALTMNNTIIFNKHKGCTLGMSECSLQHKWLAIYPLGSIIHPLKNGLLMPISCLYSTKHLGVCSLLDRKLTNSKETGAFYKNKMLHAKFQPGQKTKPLHLRPACWPQGYHDCHIPPVTYYNPYRKKTLSETQNTDLYLLLKLLSHFTISMP